VWALQDCGETRTRAATGYEFDTGGPPAPDFYIGQRVKKNWQAFKME